jgi:hypothetical protein
MFIAGKMLDTFGGTSLAFHHKLSETGFPLLCLSAQKTHTCGLGGWAYDDEGGKGY